MSCKNKWHYQPHPDSWRCPDCNEGRGDGETFHFYPAHPVKHLAGTYEVNMMFSDEYDKVCAELGRARQIINNLLSIFDSDAMRATESIAHVHGFECDEETSKRHGGYVADAREFVK